ncbi:membrane protein [Salmonella enterica subsp. enterica]|nr:membrane protein [Salmonella enterica subsp. enterica]
MIKKSTYDVSHHSAVCGVTGDYYRISATYHIKRSIRVFLIILCCLLPGGVFAGSLINAGFISPIMSTSVYGIFWDFMPVITYRKKIIH